MDTTQQPLLSARGLSKRFGATCALRSADLTVQAGQVHALMGENGAGKSTLVKMLVGALQPDAGTIALAGAPVIFHSVRGAIAAGIIPVYQHSTLFPEMTVAENLNAFDAARENPLWRRKAPIALSTYLEIAKRMGLIINPAQMVNQLSMAERQLLEITRGVARNCQVLLLDEPTAALNAHEAERLFAAINSLKQEGKGIIFISHKLSEITQICDVVTVLRDGCTVLDAVPTKTLRHHDIVEAMVGPVALRSERELPIAGKRRLQVSGLKCGVTFDDLSLNVACGEIIGIAGLIGSGAIEVGEVLGGARSSSSGKIQVDGVDVARTSRRRFKQIGVGLVPADRTADGIFPGLSCAINAVASAYTAISVSSFLSNRIEVNASKKLFEDLRVKPSDPGAVISALSGGNQQKLLIIRNLLMPNMKVLILLEPTRGVDVHARDAIHDAIIAAARTGISVVVASSDIEEVMMLSHRVYVMRNGRLADVFKRGADPSEILACISGVSVDTGDKAAHEFITQYGSQHANH